MSRVVVAAFGPDRPGMISAITGVLMGHGGNLEDTSMTVLQGNFAMMLVVSVPEGQSPSSLEEALARDVASLGLTVVVRPLDQAPNAEAEADTFDGQSNWSVSLRGADRPGIVHRVTKLLADHGANVIDLSTRVIGSPDDPVYVMLFDIVLGQTVLGQSAKCDQLQADLETLSEELGVEVHMRPHEPDLL